MMSSALTIAVALFACFAVLADGGPGGESFNKADPVSSVPFSTPAPVTASNQSSSRPDASAAPDQHNGTATAVEDANNISGHSTAFTPHRASPQAPPPASPLPIPRPRTLQDPPRTRALRNVASTTTTPGKKRVIRKQPDEKPAPDNVPRYPKHVLHVIELARRREDRRLWIKAAMLFTILTLWPLCIGMRLGLTQFPRDRKVTSWIWVILRTIFWPVLIPNVGQDRRQGQPTIPRTG
ncbi:hypothetical protein L596_027243 [Steinernema carpocapsae]|uniref:Uncharacterized protein n=1 Tax=Steinernema carpocapsae TaxID=34508 RepID=A0A4U5M3R3_STECR|nr:hypothetical protein L596_027243 [Steinernema carpocapsae]